jgi:hypothetical protein
MTLDLNRRGRHLGGPASPGQLPEVPHVEVRRGGGLFGSPNKQDQADADRMHRIRNLGAAGALAQLAVGHVAVTGFHTATAAAQHMEDNLCCYSHESRTRVLGEALFQPTLELLAESTLAINQTVARAVMGTLGR